jgi:hypothetical protein
MVSLYQSLESDSRWYIIKIETIVLHIRRWRYEEKQLQDISRR